MSTSAAQRHPKPLVGTSSPATSKPRQGVAPSQAPHAITEEIQSYVDLTIALVLSRWPALTLAVTNNWGGPDSSAKRDWLAGSVSELFHEKSDDIWEEDVEFRLLDVMESEFDVNLEDGSEIEVAAEICRIRKHCLEGKFEETRRLRREWEDREAKRKTGGVEQVGIVQGPDVFECFSDSEDDDEEDGGVTVPAEDVDMVDAPSLEVKPKVEPEVDADGFTKVMSKRRR